MAPGLTGNGQGGPSAADIVWQLEHRTDDKGGQAMRTNIALFVLAALSVGARILSRRVCRLKLGLDDYAILIALVLILFQFIVATYGIRAGLGKHAIPLGPTKVIQFFKIQFIFLIAYCLAICAVRISVLMLYYRIFFHRIRVKRWLYALGAISIACSVSGVFILAFQCKPVALAWDKSGKIEGTCINITIIGIASSIVNILIDFSILFVPMPIVWSLLLPKKQKLAICGIFLLGGLASIAGVFRAYYLIHFQGVDPTWKAYWPAFWSTIEIDLGVVCACLPVLRPLFVDLKFPNLSDKFDTSLRKLRRSIRGTNNHSNPSDTSFGPDDVRSSEKSRKTNVQTEIVSESGSITT